MSCGITILGNNDWVNASPKLRIWGRTVELASYELYDSSERRRPPSGTLTCVSARKFASRTCEGYVIELWDGERWTLERRTSRTCFNFASSRTTF